MRTVTLSVLLLLAVSAFAQTPAPSPADTPPPPPDATVHRPAYTPAQQPGANGQPPTDQNGTVTFHRTSRLVVLDVVVRDSAGNIVHGLTRNNFFVTENKDPQHILQFDESSAALPSPEVTINSTADLDRLAPRAPVNIILLDEFNTRFEDMAFARYSLKKFLSKQPDKLTTPTMLIAVSLNKFTVLHDYTQDKGAILDALNHHFVAYPWQLRQIYWAPDRFATAFSTLMQVAEATIGHPGHKNMIWIGRGFPAINWADQPVDSQNRVDSAVQVCVNMLRDARVTLYAIDPAGLLISPAEAYGPIAAFNDPFGGNYQFTRLAEATGGKALYGRNDVDKEIGTTVDDGTDFYTLTYRPTDDNLDPVKFRSISVKLDEPGLVATTRKGYYVQTPPRYVDPERPSRRLAFDLISADTNTIVYDGVPLTITPSATDPDNFSLHIDGKNLRWTPATPTEARRVDLILVYSLFDKKGKELQREGRNITAHATADVPPNGPMNRALNLDIHVKHDPKAVRARFVVRVNATGRMGTADAQLDPKAKPVMPQQAVAPAQQP